MAKTVGQSLISKLYPESVKTASSLDKLANDSNVDISSLTPQEREELASIVLQHLQGENQMTDHGQAAVHGAAPTQIPGQAVATPSTPTTELSTSAAPLGVDPAAMQEKIAETIYLSDLFGKNAADRYWERLAELQEMAQGQTITSDIEQEFEDLAQQRANELTQIPQEEVEKIALNYLIEKRAQEILASRG